MDKLSFTIEHEPFDSPLNTADWYVYGNQPDWSGDYCWGHFTTRDEALDFAQNALGVKAKYVLSAS